MYKEPKNLVKNFITGADGMVINPGDMVIFTTVERGGLRFGIYHGYIPGKRRTNSTITRNTISIEQTDSNGNSIGKVNHRFDSSRLG